MINRRLIISIIFMSILSTKLFAQGYNHTFLIGYSLSNNLGRIDFNLNSINTYNEIRQLRFRATQANISDANGNLLFASNGCWIMNSNKDTMLNGSELNPGLFTDGWCDQNGPGAMPIPHGNLIIPFPGDSAKYILFHQTGDYSIPGLVPSKVYYTVVDMNLDGGLGGVPVNQKNLIAFSDTLSAGIAACKHANGRDWWIVALKDNSNIVYKVLLTSSGIASITTQIFNFPLPYPGNAGQPTFSPDGKKFAFTSGYTGSNPYHDIRLFHFDRCTGLLYDSTLIPFNDGTTGFGLAFSSDSKYLYHSSFTKIFQINTDTTNIVASVDTVAYYDGYISGFPPNCCATDFWLMYLAANGKIYISSGSGVVDMHFINYPDSAGLACDVQQHALPLPCLSGRGNVNHPNYYLGCDTTLGCTPCYVGIEEHGKHDFKFSIMPNPNYGNFKIIYLLPQNRNGTIEIFDINGRKVYEQNLPQWSTLQYISVPYLSEGMYSCVLTSGNERVVRKMVVLRE